MWASAHRLLIKAHHTAAARMQNNAAHRCLCSDGGGIGLISAGVPSSLVSLTVPGGCGGAGTLWLVGLRACHSTAADDSIACCGPVTSIDLRNQTLSSASSGCRNAPLLTIGRTQLHAHSTIIFIAVKLCRALCTHQWHALAASLQQYSLAVQLQPVAESAPMQLLQQQEAASAGVHAST
eukprot:18318-Heterococcus_DN1.PRE.1